MSLRWIPVTAAVAALAVAGSTWAGAAVGHHRVVQPAAAHHTTMTPHAAIDVSTETKFVPINACRIADTRNHGGPIGANQTRNFRAIGTNLAGQGGQACDIPAGATALEASVMAVNATGTGYLRVWKWGASLPVSTFLNYSKDLSLRGAGAIAINGAATYPFRVEAFAKSTDVVIDVTGYYLPSLWAHVSAAGSLVSSSRATAVTRLSISPAFYQVDFDRDVTQCAYTATTTGDQLTADVEPRTGDPKAVFVAFTDENGANAASDFYLQVTC